MSASGKRLRWLTIAHFVLGSLFALAWGSQTIVFALVLSEFIRSSVVGKIGLISSALYALLGLFWVVTGFLLRAGNRAGLVRALAIVELFIFPFGLVLAVPTLILVLRRAELGAPPNGGPAMPSGNLTVTEGPPSVS
jgi:hypothetical protein